MSRTFLLACLLLAACGGEQLVPGAYAQSEPFRVLGGQFFKGPLPGETEASSATDGLPEITSVDYRSTSILPDQASKALGGRVTDPAVSVGIRFEDLGTGYWVVPIGVPDPQYPGEHTFGAAAAFLPDLPPGNHNLLTVGLLADGRAGLQQKTRFCVGSTIPDRGHFCNPEKLPLPAFVLQLHWGQPVDLDLQVLTPAGRLVSSKNPYVNAPKPPDEFTGVAPPPDDSGGYIDRDGGRICSPDPLDRESLVFPNQPAPGVYSVFASLFDACGQPGVTFEVHLYRSEGSGTEARFVEVTAAHTVGQLTSVDANGGATKGVHLVDVTF